MITHRTRDIRLYARKLVVGTPNWCYNVQVIKGSAMCYGKVIQRSTLVLCYEGNAI